MVPKPINCGKTWSSFENDQTVHYNEYAYLLKMTSKERLTKESALMDELQNDPREFPRYYAIDARWIDDWLAYMQAGDKVKPPGTIDNRAIAKQLTQQ